MVKCQGVNWEWMQSLNGKITRLLCPRSNKLVKHAWKFPKFCFNLGWAFNSQFPICFLINMDNGPHVPKQNNSQHALLKYIFIFFHRLNSFLNVWFYFWQRPQLNVFVSETFHVNDWKNCLVNCLIGPITAISQTGTN